MKKTISLVAIDNDVLHHYQNELNSIFKDAADIRLSNLDTLQDGYINTDLIIVTSPYLMKNLSQYDRSNVIYLDLCLEKKHFELLKKTKAGFNVICMHKYRIRSLEIVSYLKELGINHINLRPMSPDAFDDKVENNDLAITFSPKTDILMPISKVIDLGWRKIDISTLIEITERLNIHEPDIIKKIRKYSENNISINKSSNMFLSSTQIIKDELNNILDVIDDGIIILNSDEVILDYNYAIFKVFDMPDEILYLKNSRDYINNIFDYDSISKDNYYKDKLIKLVRSNKYVLISKMPLNKNANDQLDIIVVKDATKLINLEKYLKKDTVSRGYVGKYNFNDIIGESKEVKSYIMKAKKFAKTNLPVLILGESGTGKELLANSIHNYSDRKNKPFIGINCIALPPSLLESELFGYEEGAFTGASKHGKEGLIESANTGTLFLDEIGDLPLEFQGKLLRFLEEKEIIKIGGSRVISLDTRIIAATNKDLHQLVLENKFRKDLYYRLNILSITLPSLRERKEDIRLIIDSNLKKFSVKKIKISDEVYNILSDYYWEGNIRELRNCIQYMLVMSNDKITKEHIPENIMKAMNKRIYQKKELVDLDKEAVSMIKQILSENKTVGRRKIVEILKTNGISVSEYKVRKILDDIR